VNIRLEVEWFGRLRAFGEARGLSVGAAAAYLVRDGLMAAEASPVRAGSVFEPLAETSPARSVPAARGMGFVPDRPASGAAAFAHLTGRKP
jgi:hypothetical protein